MRDMSKSGVNKFRIKDGPLGSEDDIGNHGSFRIPMQGRAKAFVVATEGDTAPHDWEHVSTHIKYENTKGKVILRTPTWDEMNMIKRWFWRDDETVFQFHPNKGEYVNIHPHCLHLWRKKDTDMELPPIELV